jgi:hypothetical protein
VVLSPKMFPAVQQTCLAPVKAAGEWRRPGTAFELLLSAQGRQCQRSAQPEKTCREGAGVLDTRTVRVQRVSHGAGVTAGIQLEWQEACFSSMRPGCCCYTLPAMHPPGPGDGSPATLPIQVTCIGSWQGWY